MKEVILLSRCFKAASLMMRCTPFNRCDHLLPRFMSSQTQSVACLPVPPLKQTLNKYLLTARPLLSSDLYQHACQLVEKFEATGGKQLQELLEERARTQTNWLEEWWQNYAYLECRLPVPIHVNPGILIPQFPFRGTDDQLRYAANFISRSLEYKKMIDAGSVPVEYMNGTELCMSQYYHVLGGCRVPGATRDLINLHTGGNADSPKHITVIHNGHIFSVDVYDSEGQPLSSQQLYRMLLCVIDKSADIAVTPVGLLTSQHRDVWFKVFTQLNKDSVNRLHLLNIQSSIFVLSLDNSVPSNTSQETVQLNQVHHGGGSHSNSINRWFDKILQVFVSPDGFIGFNYEHSTAEGPPVMHLIDYCCSGLDGNIGNEISPVHCPLPRRLDFRISWELQEAVSEAANTFDTLIQDLDLISFTFDKFGKRTIKSHQMSPDAFIQVAFQLAYYRLYGECAATYESGSLRKFHHGRTDTIRSCSQPSLTYCKAMDSEQSKSEKSACLKAATEVHRNYTNQVINGNGIDRHLLGLKLIAADNGLPLPQLLTDPVYERTCYWQLSTSQVASGLGGLLCFGPVVSDGYGICYNPMDSKVLFSISSWKSCQHTNASHFAASLKQSLMDGLAVCNSASKL